MLSTVLELLGAVALIVAAFNVNTTVGLAVSGVLLLAAGILVERTGH